MFRNLKKVVAVMLVLAVLLPATFVSAAPDAPANGLVWVQAYAEATGAKVVWNAEFHTLQVTANDVTVYLTEGAESATVSGVSVPLGKPFTLENGKAMVSPDFLNQAFGVYVQWNAQTGKATVDQAATKAAAAFKGILTGKLAAADMTPALAALMPEPVQAAVAQGLKAQLGQLRGYSIRSRTRNAVHESIEFLAGFEAMPVTLIVHLTPAGLVDDFHIGPYIQSGPVAGAPAYADPQAFTDKEVVIGAGSQFPLPGTLSMPVGQGPFPAVVLVHGSGAADRDESLFGVKVFRDVAQGLASRGIAALRYEKRTREHPQKFTVSYTLASETLDDAVEAGKLLAKTEGIDPKRIFVVGHSLGAITTPRILQREGGKLFAGGVMMAAANDPIEVLLEQVKILARNGEAPEQQVKLIESQVAILQDPKLDPSKPVPGFVLGPVSYWVDVRQLVGPMAREVKVPLLLLQGARDYQVQAKQLDDLKDAMVGKTNAEFKLYPKLNHLFTEGEGPMGATEYLKPQNVPIYVIDDIANWVKAH